jgi:hypothetical protein
MKTRFTLFISAVLMAISSFAQTEKNGETYQFKKLVDDPTFVSDKIVSLAAVGNFSKNAALSVGFSADVIWGLIPKVDLFGGINYAPINFTDFASHDIDLGGSFTFATSTKTKETKIVLKWSDSQSTSAQGVTTRSTSATYLTTDALYLRKYKLRGGYYSHRSAMEISVFEDAPFYMTGIFAGFEFSTQAAVYSQVDDEKGVTSGLTRIYADAFLAPMQRINKVDQGVGVGAKVGFYIYMLPNKAHNAKPERLAPYQAYNSMFFKSELGFRPTEGLFFMMGTGLMIFRNK